VRRTDSPVCALPEYLNPGLLGYRLAWVVSEYITNRGLRHPGLRLQAETRVSQATERGFVIHGITLAPEAEGKLHVVSCR
jgi:hypothetical protein